MKNGNIQTKSKKREGIRSSFPKGEGKKPHGETRCERIEHGEFHSASSKGDQKANRTDCSVTERKNGERILSKNFRLRLSAYHIRKGRARSGASEKPRPNLGGQAGRSGLRLLYHLHQLHSIQPAHPPRFADSEI